jgi:hypothetical protein
MRLIFGVLSLLVALVIVGSLARNQLHALNGGVAMRTGTAASSAALEPPAGSRDGATVAVPGGTPGATAADTSDLTVQQQSQKIQQQFRDDAARAMQQGVDRNARAVQ